MAGIDGNILRVTATVVVEIDMTKWETNYGTGETPEQVRAVVKETADALAKEHFDRVGVLAKAVS